MDKRRTLVSLAESNTPLTQSISCATNVAEDKARKCLRVKIFSAVSAQLISLMSLSLLLPFKHLLTVTNSLQKSMSNGFDLEEFLKRIFIFINVITVFVNFLFKFKHYAQFSKRTSLETKDAAVFHSFLLNNLLIAAS